MKSDRRKREEKAAMIIAIVALLIVMGGTAYAAFGRNTVGSRQLKAGAVTGSKFADDSIDATKVPDHSLTGADINLSKLGKVPSAVEAESASATKSLDGYAGSCAGGTILIHGLCFDSSPSGPVTGIKVAADKCAEAGGWLPSPSDLTDARADLNLGDGNGTHAQFTDSYYYAEPNAPAELSTNVVSEAGEEPVLLENKTHEIVATYEYTCVYPLVR
jgi:hypothetical protein